MPVNRRLTVASNGVNDWVTWGEELDRKLDREILVGSKVRKASGKPFKSKLRVATVKEKFKLENGRLALRFEEDDSWVEIYRCVPFISRMKFK